MATKKTETTGKTKKAKTTRQTETTKTTGQPREKTGRARGAKPYPPNVVTQAYIAKVTGVTKSAVSKSPLPTVSDSKGNKRYDLNDPEVKAYIEGKRTVNRRRRPQIRSKAGPSVDFEGEKNHSVYLSADLKAIVDSVSDPVAKLNVIHDAEKVEWTRERRIKVQLENAIRKKDLIPVNIVRIWIGAFVPGIRNNLLPLGKRIARGDRALQTRIDEEIQRATEKLLESSIRLVQDSDVVDSALSDLISEAEEDEQ